jgi:hypothetical protein
MQRTMSPSDRVHPFKLNFGYYPRAPVGEIVDVVHFAFAAFVERLQSSVSHTRKFLIAAQQGPKAFADKRRVEEVYKVGEKVMLSTKYLNLKHSKVHLKSCKLWNP